MKKKILMIVLVVMLSLVICMTAFACNKNKGNKDNKNNENPAPSQDQETNDVEFADVFDAIVASADNTVAKVGSVKTEAFADATVYVKVGTDLDLSVRVAGNFSKTNVNANKGVVEIKDGADTMMAIYVEGGTAYIGEAYTQAPNGTNLNWFALNKVSSSSFISEYFAKLPDMIASLSAQQGFATGNFLSSKLGSVSSLVGSLGGSLFDFTCPEAFDAEEEKYAGDYKLSLKIDAINSLLSNPTVTGMIGGFLSEDLVDTINLVSPMLLGMEVKLADGKLSATTVGKTPSIVIGASIADDNTLKAVSISYNKEADGENEAVAVEFGVKVNALSATATTTALKPSYMPANVDELALKLTVNATMAQKGIEATATIYAVPTFTFKIDTETNAITYEITNLTAFGTIEGKRNGTNITPVKAYYDFTAGKFAIDVEGIYELFGTTPYNNVYYNFETSPKLADVLGGKDEVQNGEATPKVYTNKLDQIIDMFANGTFALDKAGDMLNIAKKALEVLKGAYNAGVEDDGKAVINFMALVNGVKDSKVFDGSELTKINEVAFTDYLDTSKTVGLIADVLDLDKADLIAIIANATGIEENVVESTIFSANTVINVEGNISKTASANGLGGALEIVAGGNSVAKAGLYIDFVGKNSVSALESQIITELNNAAETEGINIHGGHHVWDKEFVQLWKDVLDTTFLGK